MVTSLQYLGAATKLLRLMQEFEHPQLKAALGQYAVELESTARTYEDRAATFLEVTAVRNARGEIVALCRQEEPVSLSMTPPPRPSADTEPPEPSPKTLRSERTGT